MGRTLAPPRRRTAAVVLFLGLAALASGLVLLLVPLSNGYESCGNAVVSATAPSNDDSWFSICADRRAPRQDAGLPLVVVGLVAATAGSVRLWSIHRSSWSPSWR